MSKLPTLRPSLLDYLVEQKRGAERQANSSAFARSGTSVTAEGVVTVAGAQQSADFDGDLAAGNAGTKGWALNAVRAAFGELFLRPGSVGNDALTNPVTAQSVYGFVTNFAITATGTTVKTITIAVPAGFTSAVVSVTGRCFGVNPNTTGGSNGAGADYLYCVGKVNGLSSTALALPVGGNLSLIHI